MINNFSVLHVSAISGHLQETELQEIISTSLYNSTASYYRDLLMELILVMEASIKTEYLVCF
jgi:hypothetical protein